MYGQILIEDATLVLNLLGNHDYDTSTFITNLTFDEILAYKYEVAEMDLTANVYVATCYLVKTQNAYTKNYYLYNEAGTLAYYLYAGSGAQYDIYQAFSEDQIEITVTFMLCNWNSKTEYRACIITATDGTTEILNNFNFR